MTWSLLNLLCSPYFRALLGLGIFFFPLLFYFFNKSFRAQAVLKKNKEVEGGIKPLTKSPSELHVSLLLLKVKLHNTSLIFLILHIN